MAKRITKITPILERDPELDALAAWPFPDSTNYFFSGMSTPGDIQALADYGLHVGVVAQETADRSMSELEKMAKYTDLWCFVDSGAFGEVKFDKATGAPSWPDPITDRDWIKILSRYARIAEAFGPRTYLVAPDRVADQQETLSRQLTYANEMFDVAVPSGANVIIPVQKGPMSMMDFYNREYEILTSAGIPGNQLYPGIPLRAAAVKIPELVDFLSHMGEGVRTPEEQEWRAPLPPKCNQQRLWRGRLPNDYRGESVQVEAPRVHFLGRGTFVPEYRETFAAAMKVCPEIEVTSDTSLARRLVGEPKRGRPGPLYLARTAVKATGVTDAAEAIRKAWGIVLDQIFEEQLIDAVRAGWYDSELFESAAEEMAWMEAGKPDPDVWAKMWLERSGRPGHRG